MEKGIAFPTCLSPNSLCGHYSPLKSETQKLKEGDVVKM
jgi:methionine aminopeptidase